MLRYGMTVAPDDSYRTIRTPAEFLLRERGSRFLGRTCHVTTPKEAEEFIASQRQLYHDARHTCFAWRLGTTGGLFRYADDGEPAGSAGKPILAAIDRAGVTDVVVGVTRWFGGTKLGIGGLIRSYGGTADGVLDRAGTETRYLSSFLDVAFPHIHTSSVMHVVSVLGLAIVTTTYDDRVHLRISVRRSRLEEARTRLIDHTHGGAIVTIVQEQS